MNKAALGTIVGATLLGLVKAASGSRSEVEDIPKFSTAEFIDGELYLYGKPYREFHPYLQELQDQIMFLLDELTAVGITTLDQEVNGKHINRILLEDHPEILEKTGFETYTTGSRFFSRRLRPINLDYYQKNIPNLSDHFGILIGDKGSWSKAKVGPGDQKLKAKLTLGVDFLGLSDLNKRSTLAHELYHILDHFDDGIGLDESGKTQKETFEYLSSPNEVKAYARQLAYCLSKVRPDITHLDGAEEISALRSELEPFCGPNVLLTFQKLPAEVLIQKVGITEPRRIKNMKNAGSMFRQYLNYFLKVYHEQR